MYKFDVSLSIELSHNGALNFPMSLCTVEFIADTRPAVTDVRLRRFSLRSTVWPHQVDKAAALADQTRKNALAVADRSHCSCSVVYSAQRSRMTWAAREGQLFGAL